MQLTEINLVYFSATNTTKKVVRTVAGQFTGKISEYNITQTSVDKDVVMDKGNLLIVGMPVYAGRIPASSLESLNRFKGNGTPAIIICVYGNRDYDDALLELKDIVENNGFKAVSAGAFVAQHSIFPKVGEDRPDKQDIEKIKEFANKTVRLLDSVININTLSDFTIKGNKPYKVPGKIPLQPKGNKKCNQCGTCVKQCPVHAIPTDNPRRTDKDKCISCGRCIFVCNQDARHYGGLLYKIAGKKFVKANLARKEPSTIFSTTE